MVKLYTHYTQSHEELFRKGLLLTATEFEVHAYCGQQLGSGKFTDGDWGNCTLDKVKTLHRALCENIGETIVWADCDVTFISKCADILSEAVSNKTIACQLEPTGEFCTGLMSIRVDQQVIDLFSQIINTSSYFKKNSPGDLTDQAAFNSLVDKNTCLGLEVNKFWNVGHSGQTKNPKLTNIRVPRDLHAFHANWIVGVKRKMAAIEYVWEQIWLKKYHKFFAAESNSGKMASNENFQVAMILEKLRPCNMLIFGGYDNESVWEQLNQGGKTVFIEQDQNKDDHIQELQSSAETQVICGSRTNKLPKIFEDIKWDVILINETTGADNEKLISTEALTLAQRGTLVLIHAENYVMRDDLMDRDSKISQINNLHIFRKGGAFKQFSMEQ